MEKFNWLHLFYAVTLISTAQVIVWFQHNWQFINPKYKVNNKIHCPANAGCISNL